MELSKETKEKFLKLFSSHEIVIVSRKYGNTAASYENKFIGTHNGLKWDFTSLVIYLSGCKSNASGSAARGFYDEILRMALQKLETDGFDVNERLIMHVSEYCQCFYF